MDKDQKQPLFVISLWLLGKIFKLLLVSRII